MVSQILLSIGALLIALSTGRLFAADLPSQSFTYQGKFFNASGSAPLTSVVDLTLEIYSPGSDGTAANDCLLYAEKQTSIDLSLTGGMFSVQVGSSVGAPKRLAIANGDSKNDPGLTMAAIFSNKAVALRAPLSSECTPGYSPSSGDARKLRVTVWDGGVPTVLAPDQVINAVPQATNAETLQGVDLSSIIQVTGNITSTNLGTLVNGADAGSSLHHHDSLYLKTGGSSSKDLGSGNTYTTGNLGVGTTSPSVSLEIVGPTGSAFKLVDGNQGAGKVLVSDADGKATWQSTSSLAGATGASGADGASGATGASGAQGNSGATGASGAQGNSGATGASGAQGNSGATGASGAQGMSGATGASGANGADGNSGASGATGAAGAQGNSGESGATGASGANGADGNTGASGATGAAGAQGNSGASGATGAAGAQGNSGASGATGAAGAQGNSGASGATGAAGAQGNSGASGATGAAGAQGNSGATGASGANGAQGMSGATGASGANGAQGMSGATGASGANGAQGMSGATGASGANGAQGMSGATGASGANGAQGMSGATGASGANGAQGMSGATGASGANGAQGMSGATGASGANGADGNTGASGATGAAGAQGNSGASGATGAAGAQGTSGATGASGANGAQGMSGATGASGANGAQGMSGATGASGANGADGNSGASGATGAAGAQGNSGATGASGAQGMSGATGASGANGADGSTGASGATGTAGAQGNSGASGATGAAGVQGNSGATGTSGANGADGNTGASGATGATGTQGNSGASGATGAAGAQGNSGATGASGANGAGGNTGASGATGAAGAQGNSGASGATGAAGAQGLSGATGASGSDGAVGNTGASGAQGVSGATGASGSAGAVGNTGASGAQGVSGATGASGSAGAVGNTGATGAAGAQGNSGATGATGADGAIGFTGATGANGAQGNSGTSGATGATGASPFSLNGSNAYYTAGSVGIGTTAPAQKFTVTDGVTTPVNSVAGATPLISAQSNGSAYYMGRDNSAGIEFLFGTSVSGYSFSGSSSNHAYSLRTANVDRLFITNSGNVGIGTTSPTRHLTIAGNPGAGLGEGLNLQHTGTGGREYSLLTTDDTNAIGGGKFTIYDTSATAHRLVIDSSGNVGIGTTGPSSILDVNGALTQRGMSAPGVAPTGQGRIYYDSTANKFKVSQNGAAYGDLVAAGSSPAGANTEIQFNSSGVFGSSSNLVYDGTTFRVGPNALPYLTVDSSNTSVIQKLQMNTDGTAAAPAIHWGLSASDTNTGIFHPAADTLAVTTGGSERLRVDNAGKVGIGKTAPISTFDVSTSGDAAIAGVSNLGMRITYSTNTPGQGPGIGFTASSTDTTLGAKIVHIRTAGNSQGDLAFFTNPNGAGGDATTEKLRIKDDGNVGIGTTSPAAKLHVTGNVKIVDGSQGSGKILTSDANGLASWAAPSAAAGATGATGFDGALGMTGASGAGGTTGATGSDGAAGATGASGAQGASGASGASGATGATGSNGASGVTGATGASPFLLNASDAYYNAGNVGIGSSTPSQKLTVSGGNIYYSNNTTAGATPDRWFGQGAGNSISTDPSYGVVQNSWTGFLFNLDSDNNDADSRSFYIAKNSDRYNGGAPNGTTLFKVEEGGNVGIGTSSPTAKLDVAGQIISRSYNAGANTTIDFNNGNVQYTSAAPGAITLSNMQDGGAYTVICTSATSGTFTFSHTGLTFKFVPGNTNTAAGSWTTYSMIRAGNTVLVSWVTGF